MELSIPDFEHWTKYDQTVPTPRAWQTRERESRQRLVWKMSYKSERAVSTQGEGRKALEGKRWGGKEEEGEGCKMKPDSSIPTLMTTGDCGSPKSRRGQGRHVILNLVHSSSSCKQITKDWPLPPLGSD